MINSIFHHVILPWRFRAPLASLTAIFCLLLTLVSPQAQAQITIGGNVYGGGNQGDLGGNTSVTIRTCEIQGSVFGGARMADVGGRTFVHIDRENAIAGETLIKTVYGGNDIAGIVGKNVDANATTTAALPAELTEVGTTKGKNDINDSWTTFVRTSKSKETETKDNRLIIGTIFGGGNGDYNYFNPGDVIGQDGEGHDIISSNYRITDKRTGDLLAESSEPFTKPELAKTYLELLGGELAHVYGGGNNVTVTKNTTICLNNTSLGLSHLLDSEHMAEEFITLAKILDKNTFQGNYSSFDYTFARVFGGNNKAPMSIMPVWNIQRGRIRDLYSGGNEGNMTSEFGLLMDIDPLGTVEEKNAGLYIYNVYGGCRRADVDPKNAAGNTPTTITLPADDPRYNTYKFPTGLSARTLVRGGYIVNVYGGNDISGRVFGGDAVGIYSTVYGDVYGAGNGSYSYTDNPALGALDTYKDYYYNIDEVREKEREYSGNSSFDFTSGFESVEALNIFRPNAEQISIRVQGSETNPTIIKGSIYLGGNSATLKRKGGWQPGDADPLVELKIGSHVIVDKTYLGNNGENMVTEEILHRYKAYQNTATGETVDTGDASTDFSQLNLLDAQVFAKYMDGCAMSLKPRVVFDLIANNDQDEYEDYSSQFGSFYCGGNRGSMTWEGTNTIDFNRKVIIYDKFVGGCNNANIEATQYNAAYFGGMIGSTDEQGPMGMKNPDGSIKDCLILNLRGMRIEPKRWVDPNDPLQGLEWNTFNYTDNLDVDAPALGGDKTIERSNTSDLQDFNRRIRGGNIYGGCYVSGRMNGNVVINILDDLVETEKVFDVVTKENPELYSNDKYTITKRNSGVILDEQGMDPLGMALNVFGAGYGKDTEIWGSTSVNLKKGFVFQIFGGGQEGVIGQAREDFAGTALATVQTDDYEFNNKHYFYDPRFSTYINLNDTTGAVGSATSKVAETTFVYGGSFQAPIAGNTRINLGNVRLFNTFAGSCNADILGHTETFVGKGYAKNGNVITGFPYVLDHIYGGNDLGGRIYGAYDFTSHVKDTNGQDITKVHRYDASSNPNPDVLSAGAYIEYTQGRIVNIFGGAFGDYDYTDEKYREYCNADGSNKAGFTKPRLGNAFVNFKPISTSANSVSQIYGAGQGRHYVFDRDVMQERSYILIDIPQTIQQFTGLAVFGAGAFSGLGMDTYVANKTQAEVAALDADAQNTYYDGLDAKSAVIDLFRGQIKNVYGGSYQEGVTRRTVVNVPAGSTVVATNLFGGAYGVDNRYPCDVYESHVNYNSENAFVTWGIFGGNNNARRTLFTNVEINAPVYSNPDDLTRQGYVYGAGYGTDSWAHYTNVNLNDHALVYKLYGGGSNGRVLNEPSLNAWADERAAASQTLDLSLGDIYTGDGHTVNLHLNPLAPWSALANDIEAGIVKDRGNGKEKYNTNVNIHTGAEVTGYCYGGGYGPQAVVSGDTYISLLGGHVNKDMYAAGESGPVMCMYPAAETEFRACTNAYVRGGRLRNVYGGGWKGDVGKHEGATLAASDDDVDGLTNVIVGTLTGTNLLNGIPCVERSAYGGGEGGAVYGTAHVSVNNGYIGYRFDGTDPTTFNAADYVEELDDWGNSDPERRKNGLLNSGNVFGGGYVANSYTENSYVYMYKGNVRGSVYGGGEIGPIGRGTVKAVAGAPIINHNANIFKPGQTHVYVYGGQINRNVFGGGRGYDNWGGDGTDMYKDQPEILAQMDLDSKGYVFGETDVHIYGGTIGTEASLAQGYGNVFGGGDIGFVYSGHGKRLGVRGSALSPDHGLPVDGGGFYYKYYNDDLTNVGSDAAAMNNGMTMDCAVEVAPYCQVLPGQSVSLPELETDANGKIVLTDGKPTKTGGTMTFNEGDYVPYEYMNQVKNKNVDSLLWKKLDISGVHIRNAVFAGGNVSTGSDQIFVNTNTIYGNVTASLRDVYHRDLITVGTEHTGGLYGDGNLTFVDGFRELHISNYGTDFYGLSEKISKEEYDRLTDRERAYFELEYECIQECNDKNGNPHVVGSKLTFTEFQNLFEGTTYMDPVTHAPNEAFWKQMGVCTIYAGRLLNTIQRADYAGVWGSRLVLQGARDRVPEVADYTQYTVNRVTEISLNKMESQIDGETPEDASHGNYFGIYNIVNYLGNLTSDNFFDNPRTTNTKNSALDADGTTTYYQWKLSKPTDRYRNNATSWNKVALASGVYLEMKNEPTGGSTETDWGYITGVVELDLINVKQGLGGGYVYAKNEHGVKTWHSDWDKVTLNPYNAKARTFRRFTYSTDDASKVQIETSGNFVHNVKQIVDDCFPTHNSYKGSSPSAAHYWYIKGSIYVYDQYISAYTGSATSYSEQVSIPLSIVAGSHGRLTLRDVQPNRYAYYDKNGNILGSEGADETLEINGTHYALNDPITYWDWSTLTEPQQNKFVKETYTIVEKCMIGTVEYDKGYTVLLSDAEALWTQPAKAYNAETNQYYEDPDKDATFFLRSSNNLSHDTGYALTFDIDNPMVWNDYYTKNNAIADKVNVREYGNSKKDDGTDIVKADYVPSPTYHLNGTEEAVYGQKYYSKNDVIDNTVYDTYQLLPSAALASKGEQATFEPAWVTTQSIHVSGATINSGVAITRSEYEDIWGTTIKENVNVVPAKLITSTLQLSESEYLYAGDILSEQDIKAKIQAVHTEWTSAEVDDFYVNNSSYIAGAYYCTKEGNYGGKLYRPNIAYEALDAWNAMSAEDRANFRYNYDALDLLIDPTYGGTYGFKPQYDGYAPSSTQESVEDGTAAAQYADCTPLSPALYSTTTSVDYQAVYSGSSNLTYRNASNVEVTIQPNDTLSRDEYELIPNERYHYAPITVTSPGVYYVVKEAFIRGDMPYTVGEVISKAQYDALDNAQQKPKIDVLTFSVAQAGAETSEDYLDDEGHPSTDDRGYSKVYTPVHYYYCRDSYTIGERGEGHAVTTCGVKTPTQRTFNVGDDVPLGIIINTTSYEALVNKTVDEDKALFSIIGNVPTETATLYVSRESDIYDLSKDRIISVVYLYEYEESDESGTNIYPVSERHIVNIHLKFKSGVPQIGQLTKPNTVLPGSTVGMRVPEVTTGAFEILSSGWEVFANKEDAAQHRNGTPFLNNNTRVYWYQDGYQIAYYTKTYLGKTYSNYVPFSVGNYHDIAEVMADKANHMFIDHEDAQKYGRGPKIYLDNRNLTEANTDKSELDMLKDLFDLTLLPYEDSHGEVLPAVVGGELDGHSRLDGKQIGATKNLEFILRDNLEPKKYTNWTPIGASTQDAGTGKFTQCFEGTVHGDGYTISGLNNSLFESLCGEVYNLGVTGTFSGAGIVETGTGYLENCWINTTGTPAADVKPLFNNPARNATNEGGKYDGKLVQVVNSYYPTENGYTFTADATHGTPIEKPMQSFYNGEVAYNLNGFYLQKRFFDHDNATGYDYQYLDTRDLDGEGKPQVKTEHYPLTNTFDYTYVSDRYGNVDFTFAGGSVPTSDDIRLVEDTEHQSTYYSPLWPDDYLFFGQRLTYGYVDDRTHQDFPSNIAKNSGRLQTDGARSNRVYRAPAYFQSKAMDKAYYNPYAVFADHKKDDASVLVHHNMTAIDFTGSNGDLAGGYKEGLQTNGHFFPPLLDNDGITALRNEGLTKNWLVYTPNVVEGQPTAADSKTNDVVLDYLQEYNYDTQVTNAVYRSVAAQDEESQIIHGHAVVKTGADSFSAPADRDHFLVDKQDFNAPIGYNIAAGHRMWYQRRPDTYVDRVKGWEGISLPFSVETVSTNEKGEITHFYETDDDFQKSKNGTDSKIGHEYWLREFKAGGAVSSTDTDIFEANFGYPASAPADIPASLKDKEYTNTFLWDYYYREASAPRPDKNSDTYQQDYYATGHTYEDYAYGAAAKPYIIGFPGTTYYEFDLSGAWKASNSASEINQLGRQVISFASPTGISIAVSDDEVDAAKVTADGYAFTPNYMTKDVAAGAYVLNAAGSSYEVTTAATAGVPFRPYFTAVSGGVKEHGGARYIAFNQIRESLGHDEDPSEPDDDAEGLFVSSQRGKIVVESKLQAEKNVRIVNAVGITVHSYTIQPGQIVETPITADGVYIVNNKKLSVKR